MFWLAAISYNDAIFLCRQLLILQIVSCGTFSYAALRVFQPYHCGRLMVQLVAVDYYCLLDDNRLLFCLLYDTLLLVLRMCGSEALAVILCYHLAAASADWAVRLFVAVGRKRPTALYARGAFQWLSWMLSMS